METNWPFSPDGMVPRKTHKRQRTVENARTIAIAEYRPYPAEHWFARHVKKAKVVAYEVG